MPWTTYLDQAINQLVFGDTAYTIPGTLYVALSTTTPTYAKGAGNPPWNFTEPNATGYGRVPVANDTTHWHALGAQPGSGQEQSNALTVSFSGAGASWGTVTYFGVYDAVISGNLLAFGLLSTAQTINNGDTASFAVDALTATLD